VNGPVFDSSRLMVEAAVQGAGVALAPPRMFARELQTGLLVCPFAQQVKTGSYWLTRLKSRRMAPAMALFRDWILDEAAREADAAGSSTGPYSPIHDPRRSLS
jgi:LysR family transcriptional regulator of beta-lactamase